MREPARALPSIYLPSAHKHTKQARSHSAGPLLHDLRSLLPWQGCSDEIRMTTGMTQSVALESLHGVKSRACARARANLISSDSRASLSACICDTFPLCVRTRCKRWRQRAKEKEWLLTGERNMSASLRDKVTKPL